MKYDLIIIGAGPAGLAAALDADYLRLKTLVLEANRAGGALMQTYPWKHVDSYLGFAGMIGRQVADRMISHVKSAGVEIREGEEVREVRAGKPFRVVTSHGRYQCGAVIIAPGVRRVSRRLGVPGEDLAGISYSLPDPQPFKGKRVLVVGGGDSAADSALGLEHAGARVWLAHRRDQLRAMDESRDKLTESGVEMLWSTEVESFSGGKSVRHADLVHNKTGKHTRLPVDNVIICIGSIPTKECLEGLGIKMDKASVHVDEMGMTSVPGIFAAGDIVSRIKRIPQALATGERAAYSAYKYIKDPYWK